MNRRDFLHAGLGLSVPLLASPSSFAQPKTATPKPKLTFYGSTRQVSGSCHLLETSRGLFLVDCGLFYGDVADPKKDNLEFPFDPKDVKGLFLTHGHVDHNGRLPLLYQKGFRGPIYCTDCTRDLTRIMLDMSSDVGEGEPLYDKKSVEPTMGLIQAVPYNTEIERQGLRFRYTDAGHILGSAMVEVWIDGAKILFGGDMGPDHSPILCKPTFHTTADAVLFESTYGPVPRDEISYTDFGKKVQKVIQAGGSVLVPAFALHKTQTLVYVLNKLMAEGVVDKKVPIFTDSSTAHRVTALYHRYQEYYDPEAKKFAKERKGLFYINRFREAKQEESLETHGREPAIYISTSGMLDHAAAPKHLARMAADPKNSVLLVGYQSPTSVGKKLEKGDKKVDLPWEEFVDGRPKRELRPTEIKLTVEKASGFSSHARGGQILEWLHEFQQVGQVFVVHGDEERSVGLADAAKKMGVQAVAPKRNESFTIGAADRVKPGAIPELKMPAGPVAPAAVDK
jgi:metallo-beta-lactamase family protein